MSTRPMTAKGPTAMSCVKELEVYVRQIQIEAGMRHCIHVPLVNASLVPIAESLLDLLGDGSFLAGIHVFN